VTIIMSLKAIKMGLSSPGAVVGRKAEGRTKDGGVSLSDQKAKTKTQEKGKRSERATGRKRQTQSTRQQHGKTQ
jgi:hypothetical protein